MKTYISLKSQPALSKAFRASSLAILCSLFFANAFAQDGIKSKLNEFADNAILGEQVRQEVIEKQKEIDKKEETITELEKQLENVKLIVDSVEVQDSIAKVAEEIGAVEIEEAKAIDTASFENRMFSVKARQPANAKKEEDWRKKYFFTHTNVYKKEHILDSSKQVFGWHPYWMGTAYKSYNFSLLSTIAYFSYELNPKTGGYKTIHDWKTTAMIDSAKAHNCDVLLSVTNFGKENNAAFLSNQRAQANFINTLISLLKERNADGVNIDFEAIPRRSRVAFNNFIIDLSSSLKSVRSDYRITLAVPAMDFDNVYDIFQLNQYIDTYVIMGYEFYGANSKVAGPISPLYSGQTWWNYSLETAVNEYLAAGVPNSKLLLGLPYYGAEWETQDLRFPSKAKRFIRYPMYRNIRKDHYTSGCCEDEVSKSKFFVYRDKRNNYRQIWYEDSVSLGYKYDYVIDNNLGGIGIWALGYDNGYTELWELIARKFALTEQKAALVASTRARFSWRRILNLVFRAIRNPQALLRNPTSVLRIFGALSGVSMIGFIVLFRYGNRLRRMSKIVIKSGIMVLIIAAIAALFIGFQYANDMSMLFLIIGCIVGIIIFWLFSKRFLSEKDLP